MQNIANNDKFIKFIKNKYFVLFLFSILICLAIIVLYSTGFIGKGSANLIHPVPINSQNTITFSNHYAYGENMGWIDFSPAGGNVMVGDNGLAGSAWSEVVGWIKLGNDNGPPYLNTSTSDWGVNNSGGDLSGYAYSENAGWVNFGLSTIVGRPFGVSIDSSGNFSGYAYSENLGWISFSGNGYGVYTDWRAQFPLDGSCGTAATTYSYTAIDFGSDTFCATGDINGGLNPVFPTPGDSVSWTCDGINDGTSASCTALVNPSPDQLVNGTCGTAATNYPYTATNFGTDSLCETGIPTTIPIFPAQGQSITWMCLGINGGSTSDVCAASVGSAPNIGGITSGGGGNSYFLNNNMSRSDILNYVSQQLKNIKLFILQNPSLFAQPKTPPPSNLHPNQPPPATPTTSGNSLIIIFQKILEILKSLLGTIPNK